MFSLREWFRKFHRCDIMKMSKCSFDLMTSISRSLDDLETWFFFIFSRFRLGISTRKNWGVSIRVSCARTLTHAFRPWHYRALCKRARTVLVQRRSYRRQNVLHAVCITWQIRHVWVSICCVCRGVCGSSFVERKTVLFIAVPLSLVCHDLRHARNAAFRSTNVLTFCVRKETTRSLLSACIVGTGRKQQSTRRTGSTINTTYSRCDVK